MGGIGRCAQTLPNTCGQGRRSLEWESGVHPNLERLLEAPTPKPYLLGRRPTFLSFLALSSPLTPPRAPRPVCWGWMPHIPGEMPCVVPTLSLLCRTSSRWGEACHRVWPQHLVYVQEVCESETTQGDDASSLGPSTCQQDMLILPYRLLTAETQNSC